MVSGSSSEAGAAVAQGFGGFEKVAVVENLTAGDGEGIAVAATVSAEVARRNVAQRDWRS